MTTVVRVVNVIPNRHSNETNQDSEPSVAVNPSKPAQVVVTAFTPPDSGQTDGPIYFSPDGGNTWQLNFAVAGGEPGDQSVAFATTRQVARGERCLKILDGTLCTRTQVRG